MIEMGRTDTNVVTEMLDGSVEMVVRGRLTSESIAKCNSHNVTRLVLNEQLGFSATNLDLLVRARVQELTLVDMEIEDLKPIETMRGLRALHLVTKPSAAVDVGHLPELMSLSGFWSQLESGIMNSKLNALEELTLLGFSRDDLTVLSNLRALRSLVLKDRPKLRRLSGIESLALEELRVHDARRLHTIEALGSCQGLRVLEFDGSPKLRSIQHLSSMADLCRLMIADCGSIDSLKPIVGMRSLRDLDLSGSSRITDKDLSPMLQLKNLEHLAIRSRRGYRPSVDSIRTELAVSG